MDSDLSSNSFDILRDIDESSGSNQVESSEGSEAEVEEEFSTMSTPVAPTVTYGSFSIKVNPSKAIISEDGEEILYPKEDRVKLSSDKLAELFDKATRTRHKKYDFINLTLSDEDKLDDTYNLDMLVRRTKNAHVNYDMHNVFTTVLIDPSDSEEKTIVGTKDLYTEFSEISIEEVAASNKFYNQWASEDHYSQNLRLTYAYF